jgi:hypothetical protein
MKQARQNTMVACTDRQPGNKNCTKRQRCRDVLDLYSSTSKTQQISKRIGFIHGRRVHKAKQRQAGMVLGGLPI